MVAAVQRVLADAVGADGRAVAPVVVAPVVVALAVAVSSPVPGRRRLATLSLTRSRDQLELAVDDTKLRAQKSLALALR